jgi:hypothetical protein
MRSVFARRFSVAFAVSAILSFQNAVAAEQGVSDSIEELQARQLELAKTYFKSAQKAYEDGVILFPEFVASSKEIFDAQVAVAAGAGERIAACEEYVARQKDMKDKVEALFNNGSRGGETEKYALAKLSLIKAKVLLAKERKAATARKK